MIQDLDLIWRKVPGGMDKLKDKNLRGEIEVLRAGGQVMYRAMILDTVTWKERAYYETSIDALLQEIDEVTNKSRKDHDDQ
jgi:hypothetical protein